MGSYEGSGGSKVATSARHAYVTSVVSSEVAFVFHDRRDEIPIPKTKENSLAGPNGPYGTHRLTGRQKKVAGRPRTYIGPDGVERPRQLSRTHPDIIAWEKLYPRVYKTHQTHQQPCACNLCVSMSCRLCGPDIPVVWVGLGGFSQHMNTRHHDVYELWHKFRTILDRPRKGKNAALRVQRASEEVLALSKTFRAAEEIEKASAFGVRAIPLDAISDTTRAQVRSFIQAVDRLPGVRRKLFMEAVSRVDDGFKRPNDYRKALELAQVVTEEAANSGKYAVIERKVYFDPRVSVELIKLAYALNQGYSFVVHLLLLYGLKAMSEGLRREGITPPSDVTHLPMPADIMLVDQLRDMLEKRKMRFEDDPELVAYGPSDDESLDAAVRRLLDDFHGTFGRDEDPDDAHDGLVWGEMKDDD